jgi:hypothetical protein
MISRSEKDVLIQNGVLATRALAAGADREEVLQVIAQDLIVSFRLSDAQLSYSALMPAYVVAWAESGFPVIELSHKLAASFMCTSLAKEDAPSVVMPWRCFLLNVPQGVVVSSFGELRYLFVIHSHDGPFKVLHVHDFSLDFAVEPSLLDYLYRKGDLSFDGDAFHDGNLNKCDAEKAAILSGRLLIGCCIELDGLDKKLIQPSVSGHQGHDPWRVRRGEPVATVYKLTRDVRVDCRAHVASYLNASSSTSPSVRILVRGHHKRQRCGDGGVDRKWIHIEPYWRGPDT